LARVLAGKPEHRVWNAFSSPDGCFHSGRWSSTPGLWRVRYTEYEFCHLLSGAVRLTADTGAEWTFRAGDIFLINKGFSRTWETMQHCVKLYAVYQAAQQQLSDFSI
jgi:uncharacterized cupin superfamily protein